MMLILLAFIPQASSMDPTLNQTADGQASIDDLSKELVNPVFNVSSLQHYSDGTNATGTTNATGLNASLGIEEGCSVLEMSPDANSQITKVTFKWSHRGNWEGHEIDHTGLEFETKHGKYAVAYNSVTMPGPINTPGMVWCQTGGMPMWVDMRANGNCAMCGGWHSGGSSSVKGKTLGQFMKSVKSWASSHGMYNFHACDNGHNGVANCQKTANHLYKVLAGHYPSKGHCPDCPSSCNRYDNEAVGGDEILFV